MFLQNDLITLPSKDGPNLSSHLFLQVKTGWIWNTAMHKHLHMVPGCFYTIKTEVNSRNTDLCPPKPKILTIWIFTEKNVPTSDMDT